MQSLHQQSQLQESDVREMSQPSPVAVRMPVSEYVQHAPTPQDALDLVRGTWTSRVPIPGTVSGEANLFDDGRIQRADSELGFAGRAVCELGPLEAAHTVQIERRGARSIVAIEGSKLAYMKCLIVKELFGLTRSRFLLGEANAYLETTPHTFDVIVASGILYHMRDPLRLLSLCAAKAPRLFLWTHYYDAEIVARRGENGRRFTGVIDLERDGYGCKGHVQLYGEAVALPTFCGGTAEHSVWLEKYDILRFLEHLGYEKTVTWLDDAEHPAGPCFCVAATKFDHRDPSASTRTNPI